MTRRLQYLWRVGRTGIAFAAFGALTLSLSWLVLPVARRQRRGGAFDLRAQRIVHRSCRGYLRLLEAMGVMRRSAAAADLLAAPGPHLVAANHPSLLDFVFLAALMPQADCIVSGDRADNRFLAGVVRHARYVRNDEGREIVRECVERLRAGRSLVIFPEGTRSPLEGLGPFQRGAARVALEAGCDLLPVALHCDPPTLRKGQKWYDVPDRPFCLSLRVLPPIRASTVRDALRRGECSPGAAARRLTGELREALAKAKELEDLGEGSSAGRGADVEVKARSKSWKG
jgi:1-acyl-sn-glycerol-3-phosphate acyltransferase